MNDNKKTVTETQVIECMNQLLANKGQEIMGFEVISLGKRNIFILSKKNYSDIACADLEKIAEAFGVLDEDGAIICSNGTQATPKADEAITISLRKEAAGWLTKLHKRYFFGLFEPICINDKEEFQFRDAIASVAKAIKGGAA
ncbi:hypothetical protein [Hydrogenimonas urashimensis]|uniref:hypothetical protein n=1 Tax=Hydrogenimonas urashimensis TaxID=2740515 RepID=UPI001915B978|nr:hypothetical protein [Hydrogenimonas urashimensis]